MKRRLFLILLAACLGLAACQAQNIPGTTPSTEKPTEPTPSDLPVETTQETVGTEPVSTEEPTTPSTEAPTKPTPPEAEGLGFTALDSGLIAYLRANGLAEKSFTVSPLSLKAALALTALGAEGETQRQILDVLGFQSVDALTAWYASVLVGVADFDGRIFGADKSDCAYRVVNAIFHNASCDGEFRDSYKDAAAKLLAAEASSYPAEQITAAINQWVNDQTAGMIPAVVNDASKSAAVLVNALYLKTKWTEPFGEVGMRDFTTVKGETVQKEFITKTDSFRYYDDKKTQMVVVPLQGGVSMALILGEEADLSEMLQAADTKRVRVTLPKFEVETSLSNKELVNYLAASGCKRMFVDGGAEFAPMFTQELYVDDIIQKAKVKVDEKGLEAAAATAMIMNRATAMMDEPVEFTADRSFRFVIFREDDAPELLFWGQIMD